MTDETIRRIELVDGWLKSVGYQDGARGSLAGIYPDDVTKLKALVADIALRAAKAALEASSAYQVHAPARPPDLDDAPSIMTAIATYAHKNMPSTNYLSPRLVLPIVTAHCAYREVVNYSGLNVPPGRTVQGHLCDYMGVELWEI